MEIVKAPVGFALKTDVLVNEFVDGEITKLCVAGKHYVLAPEISKNICITEPEAIEVPEVQLTPAPQRNGRPTLRSIPQCNQFTIGTSTVKFHTDRIIMNGVQYMSSHIIMSIYDIIVNIPMYMSTYEIYEITELVQKEHGMKYPLVRKYVSAMVTLKILNKIYNKEKETYVYASNLKPVRDW